MKALRAVLSVQKVVQEGNLYSFCPKTIICVSAHLASRDTNHFCSGPFSPGCFCSKWPWKICRLVFCLVEWCLLLVQMSFIKDLGSLSPELLSWKANPLQAWPSHGPLCLVSAELGLQEEINMNLNCMLLAVPWVIKFFISDPRILRLLPPSMWQGNQLAKGGKNLSPFTVLDNSEYRTCSPV